MRESCSSESERRRGTNPRRSSAQSFATAETNEQMKVRIVVPLEVPHDTRICNEDLSDTDIDESDLDELRDERKGNNQGMGPKNL